MIELDLLIPKNTASRQIRSAVSINCTPATTPSCQISLQGSAVWLNNRRNLFGRFTRSLKCSIAPVRERFTIRRGIRSKPSPATAVALIATKPRPSALRLIISAERLARSHSGKLIHENAGSSRSIAGRPCGYAQSARFDSVLYCVWGLHLPCYNL